MRQSKLLPSILGAIALIGLSSCSMNSDTPSLSGEPAVSEAIAESDAQGPVKVSGSSSSANLLSVLVDAYTSSNPSSQLELLEPTQSENTIAGVQQGLVDLGVISRALKPEDGDDGTLESREVARDALLVATHPSVTGVTNLTTEDLRGIYSGSITNWKELNGPDAEIVVLDRPEDESAKRLLREHYLGADLANAPNAVVLRKEGELIQTIQSTPYSIGAFSLAHAIFHDMPVNRLQLNGVEPTSETLGNGQYPMFRNVNLVWNQEVSDSSQAFIDFIFSQSGTEVLEQAGFAPSSP
ncbi:MAG: substrate-binding domain-containing protein [Cyanobacteria bacterium J06638_22]